MINLKYVGSWLHGLIKPLVARAVVCDARANRRPRSGKKADFDNVINIRLPELRERCEDIPLLIDHFLKLHTETNHQEARHFSNEARRLLLSSEWPGNARELENAVEHALAIGIGPTLRIPDLPPRINGFVGETGAPEFAGEARTLREVERRHILRILEETGGNHAHAAKVLGIDRRTLYRKLNKYKL